LQKIFAAGDTAKIGPATGAAEQSDRRHQKDDVEVRRNCQQGEVEQKEGSNITAAQKQQQQQQNGVDE
jgi:hypothetical protein